MFTWQSSGFHAGQTDDDESLPAIGDNDAFLGSAQEALLWSDELWSETDTSSAANSDDFAQHGVLTAAQEITLARQIQNAFAALQACLVETPAHLDSLVRHVTEERWREGTEQSPEDSERCDRIVTLHDHWSLLQHLAQSDAAWQPLADQQYLALLHAFQAFPLTRDLLLSVAESALKEQPAGGHEHPLAQPLHALYRLRNEFISRNIRLVYFVARRHLDKGVELEDLVQEGILGLFRATLKYDADAGTRFSTYAYWWILQSIRHAITRQRSLIRYPNNINLQVNRLHAYRQRYWFQHGRWPSVDDIQRHTGLSPATVRDLLGLSNLCVSADSPLREDDDRNLLDDLTGQEALPPPDLQYEQEEQGRLVERYLSLLTPREATVLRLKYGIGQEKTHTLHEIAPVIGVSGERVRQLEKLALEKIRKRAGEEFCL